MAGIVLHRLGKRYADGTRAVDNLDLDISEGEFLVLVGPSGCGKTTALRMIAGLEEITEGTVRIGGRVVNRLAARDRDVAMVFQSYALYPHLNVYDNISFGLTLRKLPKDEIDRRVREVVRTLDLADHLHRKPKNLSGGQRQRVSMGRAIVREPRAFLMDEPLSNLDAKLRVQMRAEIARIQRDLNVTTVYVTHDQIEAMTLGDRVAVLKRGVLQQVGPPQQLYDRPANLFVAGFIGSPGMNLLRAKLEHAGGSESSGYTVAIGQQRLALPPAVVAQRPALEAYRGAAIVLGIRPEDMEDAALSPGEGDTADTLSSTADLVEAMGSDVLVHCPLETSGVVTEATHDLSGGSGAATSGESTVVVGRFSPRTRVFEGQRIRIRVDVSRMHFFDPGTGLAIAHGAMPPRVAVADT
ncbi:sn-glycerol-3-phosphate ABC transporter ATP-binding protein UgpC [Haloechinothrix sp. LS1_15]|uniref:ABC transporter ATP-binding protein n=1 Tax=Haloechinothrix sp. LS1_15 TaxID=2652248 RepID=UPI00294887FD|nr:sn-glycerol-3-phosphate ABC transporter ATP-binding protein UgpC [Haloechinothrix sp. LS1_15]MDV6013012.1 sn-glycerol-3-phosphate ABC transporter ATP-binding protein UgpC [Haloechinothrix sp. LS1_15]